MPTPLEEWLEANKPGSCNFQVVAVGSDAYYDETPVTNLRDGVVNLSARDDGGRLVVPYTLCWWLKHMKDGADWTKELNALWIAEAVTGGEGRSKPKECYVFHNKIVAALASAKKGDSVSLADFDAAYKGNKNASYDEVVVILGAGYTKVTVAVGGKSARLRP